MNKILLFLAIFVIVIVVGQETTPTSGDKESHYEEQTIMESAIHQKPEFQLAEFYKKGGGGTTA